MATLISNLKTHLNLKTAYEMGPTILVGAALGTLAFGIAPLAGGVVAAVALTVSKVVISIIHTFPAFFEDRVLADGTRFSWLEGLTWGGSYFVGPQIGILAARVLFGVALSFPQGLVIAVFAGSFTMLGLHIYQAVHERELPQVLESP